MLHVFHGQDEQRAYTRTWISCDGCHHEGQPVVSSGDGSPADVVTAMYDAGFTVVGDRVLCSACCAGALGAA